MNKLNNISIKKLLKFVFLPVFIIICILLFLINSCVISVKDSQQNQHSYQYYLSTAKTENIQCKTDFGQLKLVQIEVFAISGHSLVKLNIDQNTACENIVGPNNQLGVVHVIDKQVDRNIYKSSGLLIFLIALLVSLVVSLALWLVISVIQFMVSIRSRGQTRLFDLCMFLGFVIFFGLFSVGAGQDFGWDLQNYHLYNGWAFIHNRLAIDVTPSNGFNGYLSPVLDAIQFYLTDSLSMQFHAFLIGSITGIAAFFSYKICQLFFNNIESNKNRHIYIICATLIGVTGSANLMQVGTASNENIIAAFIVIAIYFIVRFYFTLSNLSLLIAGLAMGIAIGFKLTAATYAFAIIPIFALQNLRRIKSIGILVSSIIIAFLITNGLWMYKMYQFFGNPFYPLLGNLINPATAAVFVRDMSFIPKDLIHWLFLPFFLFVNNTLTCESSLLDTRFGFVYLSIIFILVYGLKNKDKLNRLTQFMVFTFIINYVIWLPLFAIQRYTVTLEYISGLLIIMPFVLMQNRQSRIFTNLNLVVLTLIIIGTTQYSTLGRLSYKEKFYITDVKIENSLVIFNENPTAYLAPSLGVSNVYINPLNYRATSKFDYNRKDKIIKGFIKEGKPIYIVTHNISDNNQIDWLQEYKLYVLKNSCQKVNDISDILICKLAAEN